MIIDDTTVTQFGMLVLLPLMFGLIFFIIYNLAKESKAGKWGTVVLFFVLGLGIFVFMGKGVFGLF